MPVTTPEGEKVDAFVNKATETLSYLWSRWQDEKEYENIADYIKPLETMLAEQGINPGICTMTKRPFGIKINMGGKVYQVKVTSKEISWQRIK